MNLDLTEIEGRITRRDGASTAIARALRKASADDRASARIADESDERFGEKYWEGEDFSI